MSDFDCPYCGEGNDDHDLEHAFEDHQSEEIEINCKFCKKTMSLYRDFEPVYYPLSIERQIKAQAKVFSQMLDAYKRFYEPMPDWANRLLSDKKEVIKQLGELIKKNRQAANNGTAE